MNCPNCGTPAVGPGFCGRCGARVEADQSTRNLAALAGLLKPFFASQSGGGSGFNVNLGG